MVVDWLDFYDQAMKENWKPKRTLIKIRDSVGEVYGSKVGEEVMKKIKKINDIGYFNLV